jgi:cyanate permease
MTATIQSAEPVRSVDVTAVFAAVLTVVTAPVLIAHQGGWDEALLIAAPILIIMALLWLAKRRVDAAHATTHATTQATTDDSAPFDVGADGRQAAD